MKVPRVVLDEIRGCLFVASSNLRKDFGPLVFSTDASMLGYALHETEANRFMVGPIARWKERRRLKVNERVVDRDATDISAVPLDQSCEAAPHVADASCAFNVDASAPHPQLSRIEPDESGWYESPGVVQPLPRALLWPPRWVLVVCGAWGHARRIHLHEAKAALLGLRRACTAPRSEDRIVVSLGDNMGELLGQERGRARNIGLNACCRQSAGWQIAGVSAGGAATCRRSSTSPTGTRAERTDWRSRPAK